MIEIPCVLRVRLYRYKRVEPDGGLYHRVPAKRMDDDVEVRGDVVVPGLGKVEEVWRDRKDATSFPRQRARLVKIIDRIRARPPRRRKGA